MKATLCDRCREMIPPSVPHGLVEYGMEGQVPPERADLCSACLATLRIWLKDKDGS